jgi:hypothetical protein
VNWNHNIAYYPFIEAVARRKSRDTALDLRAALERFTALRAPGGTLVVQDPKESWSEVRSTSGSNLPGSKFRRRLYWRYSLVWDKPGLTRD